MPHPQPLVDQCFMWCKATGQKPGPIERDPLQQFLLTKAVNDFKGAFSDLNSRQRRHIAGLAELT